MEASAGLVEAEASVSLVAEASKEALVALKTMMMAKMLAYLKHQRRSLKRRWTSILSLVMRPLAAARFTAFHDPTREHRVSTPT